MSDDEREPAGEEREPADTGALVIDVQNPYRMHEVRFRGIQGNPVVVITALLVTWTVVIIATVVPDFMFGIAAEAKTVITRHFTWFFIGGQNAWMFFVAYLWLRPSYYHLKLGADDQEPEFSTVTWFMMMFGTAGSGTGLIFYGVGEPIYHMGYNRYLSRGYSSYDEISQEAMNLSLYHWGVHQWMCFTIMGIALGITSHRMGLPFSIRSCFYPLLGSSIFGSLGDVIDTLAVCTTIFAVCTSMGIGAIQINTGLKKLAPHIDKSVVAQVVITAVVTLVASISANAGLRKGVRVLSILSFSAMTTLLICTLLAERTHYLLNLLVQSAGHHLHYLIKLGFQTDAYAQLSMDVDGKSGPEVWMDWWTVFYWSWWVSWSPFVGVFIARISKGRTVGEVINASLTGPVLYTFIWFAVFGGAGQRMERSAILDGCLGQCTLIADGMRFDDKWCRRDTVRRQWNRAWLPNSDDQDPKDVARRELFVLRRPMGCKAIKQLSIMPLEEMWFELLFSYENIGTFMVFLSLIAMVLCIITTNDSGSIVMNMMGTNGNLDRVGKMTGHRLQKQAWSLNIGIMTILMLVAGKGQALTVLQLCIIALGLPNTFQTCVVCYAIKLAFDMELHQDTNPDRTVSQGRFEKLVQRDNGMGFWHDSLFKFFMVVDHAITRCLRVPFPTKAPSAREIFILWGSMIVIPWYWIGVCDMMCSSNLKSAAHVRIFSKWPTNSQALHAQLMSAGSMIFFGLSIGLCMSSILYNNLWIPGLCCYFFFAVFLALLRDDVVKRYNISSDAIRNLVVSTMLYPWCIAQLYAQLQQPRPDTDSVENELKRQASSIHFIRAASMRLSKGSMAQ